MIKVTDDTYENFVKTGSKTKILKLGATWCNPCQMAIPPCNELAEELGLSSPGAKLAHDMLHRANEEGYGDLDGAAIVLPLESDSDFQIKALQ